MHTASYKFVMKPEESARCHQTLSSQVGSGDKTSLSTRLVSVLLVLWPETKEMTFLNDTGDDGLLELEKEKLIVQSLLLAIVSAWFLELCSRVNTVRCQVPEVRMNFTTKQIPVKKDIEIQPGFEPGSSEFKRQWI